MPNTIIGIILLVSAVFLVISILFQSSKSHKMPGTIAGGAETFFGKSKGSTIDKMLSKLTAVVAIVFCLLVVIMYVAQGSDKGTAGNDTEAPTASGTIPPTTEAPVDFDNEGAAGTNAEGESDETGDETAGE